MAKEERNYDAIVRRLSKKRDCRIDEKRGYIHVLTNNIVDKEGNLSDNPNKSHDLGNKSWGHIDWLMKTRDFKLIRVGKFGK